MYDSFEEILDELGSMCSAVDELRETLLANLVLVGEIPAATFDEAARIRFLMDRFSECELQNISYDEAGNGSAIIPGRSEDRHILVLAHADTVFDATVDHTIQVAPDRLTGPGVADNSLGVAVLATLPTLLEHLNIELHANLILMAGVKSLGTGDLQGVQFFLKNNKAPLCGAICVEGVPLGRMSIASLGMLRGEIRCVVPEEYDWTRFGASGAIITMNEVINKMSAIKLPQRPQTTVRLGSIHGGGSFNTLPRRASLRFEIRSESEEMVGEVEARIRDIVKEMSYQTKSSVTLDVISRRHLGGIGFGHPLSVCGRKILERLGIEPRISPSTSELSALIDAGIPALTVGITDGANLNEVDETVYIERMNVGLAQLLGVVLAMDRGCCDEA